LSGYVTGANATFASVTNLANTGSTLDTKINNLSGYINSSSSNIVFTTGDQTISGVKTFTNNLVISSGSLFLNNNFPSTISSSTYSLAWYLDSTSNIQQEMSLSGIIGARAFLRDRTVWGVNLNIVGINTINDRYAAYNIDFTAERRASTVNIRNPTLISSGTTTNSPFQINSGFFHASSGVLIDPNSTSGDFKILVTPSSANRTRFKAFAMINEISV